MELKELAQDSRGNRLYRTPNGAGGYRYWSDEIGNGVLIWDTSLVSPEMLRLALECETGRYFTRDTETQ